MDRYDFDTLGDHHWPDDIKALESPKWFKDVPRWMHMRDWTAITIPTGDPNPFHLA